MRNFARLSHSLRRTATMADRVHRVTMFKFPKSEDQKAMIKEYEKLWAAVPKKDGKPYILSLTAGPAEASERSQGYTFVAKSEFASVEDMQFYDNECEAHKELKKSVKSLSLDGVPLMVYFKPQIVVGA